jgi:aminoglycoside N3'-acetyltransferase
MLLLGVTFSECTVMHVAESDAMPRGVPMPRAARLPNRRGEFDSDYRVISVPMP